MSTIYVHIGMPKTGTTSIQAFFAKFRDVLKEERILYPRVLCAAGAHFDFSSAFGFITPKLDKHMVNFKDQIFLDLVEEIKVSDPKKIIFSSENFVLDGDIDLLKLFLTKISAKIKIVVYLRRHDKWWPSTYQQSVKQVTNPPWGDSFNEFIEYQRSLNFKYWNYRNLVDKWANVFGKENILVRPLKVAK